MRQIKTLCICALATLALCALAASSAQAASWVVESKTLAVGVPPGHGKQIEVPFGAAEPLTFEVAALHETIQCKKAELVGPGGTGHAYIWNEEVAGKTIGRQEGLMKFSLCENLTKPTCTVTAAGTLNTSSVSGTLVTQSGGSKIYDMLVQQKWSEVSPFYSTFEPFVGFTQTAPCSSAAINATGFAGEIVKESEESIGHTMKFLGKPACGVARIGEVVLASGTLDSIAMRLGTNPVEGCAWMNFDLVSGEKWSVK
jgi:hypothetical protein